MLKLLYITCKVKNNISSISPFEKKSIITLIIIIKKNQVIDNHLLLTILHIVCNSVKKQIKQIVMKIEYSRTINQKEWKYFTETHKTRCEHLKYYFSKWNICRVKNFSQELNSHIHQSYQLSINYQVVFLL